MNSLTEQIIINILAQEMDLTPSGESADIWIRNQNRKIPNSDGLFIVVGMVDAQTISSTSETIPTDDGMNEIQKVILSENIQIDMYSRDNSALSRRWEILAALKSVFAQQKQEENYFTIYKIPRNFLNISDSEGGSRLNRFSLTFPCQVWYRKIKPLVIPDKDYYNDFDTRVDDAETIDQETGLIEFNISEELEEP